jgi:hypothetical protein
MLRTLKRMAGVALTVLALLLLFRGPIFRGCFHYEVLRQRDAGAKIPARSALDELLADHAPHEVDECIDAALDVTSRALSFTTGTAPDDALGALGGGRANCIGYASLFKAACERYLTKAGLAAEWNVDHIVGALHCGSFNVHACFRSPFWKDHDLCVISRASTGERIFVDPTAFDVLRIRRVSGPAN